MFLCLWLTHFTQYDTLGEHFKWPGNSEESRIGEKSGDKWVWSYQKRNKQEAASAPRGWQALLSQS